MKKNIKLTLIFVLFNFIVSFAQITKTDTLLQKINDNVESIKNEIIEEKTKPFSGQSMFEDSKGKSAVFLPNGGTFGANLADASVKLSFSQKVSNKRMFLGIDVSGKSNDGVLPLITKGNISPGAKVNGIIGVNEFFRAKDRLDGWLALKVGYEGAAFKLFKPDSVFNNQIEKISFNSFVTSLNFNLKIDGNKLFAISAGYQFANNYSDLDGIELTDKKIIVDSASNTSRIYETTTKVKVGSYKTFDQVPINVDYFWTPKNLPRVGFYHYWRTTITINDKVQNGFGTGLYLLKKNNPLSSIVGVVFEVKDIDKLNKNYGQGFVVNIVASYNFGIAKH